jgi:acyl carrier protein
MNDYKIFLTDWFNRRAPHLSLSQDENYFIAGAIDSFGVIELIEEVESTFGLRFTQIDLLDSRFVSINGLASLIDEKLKS